MPTRPLPDPADDHDRRILDVIRTHGWAVTGILAEDDYPTYSFTVGLLHTFGHPELVVAGLSIDTARDLLNAVGEGVRSGNRIVPGERYPEYGSAPLAAVAVDPRYVREYLGYACWANRGTDFPAVQLVWPAKAGPFPWEAGYPTDLFAVQPVLGAVGDWPHGWPFPDPPNAAVFTATAVMRGGRPPVYVVHDADGDWQFLTGDPVSEADAMVVAFAEVLRRFPAVGELATLPRGWRAVRTADGWERERIEDE
jgi:hypothetical protein